ncbi:hypothetical protein LZ31DRAFT_40885 [Colletotrichum somersetense]|nr:hypothetical protein LZ31DRAFT_40885 [Colletotrichum somersetense]
MFLFEYLYVELLTTEHAAESLCTSPLHCSQAAAAVILAVVVVVRVVAVVVAHVPKLAQGYLVYLVARVRGSSHTLPECNPHSTSQVGAASQSKRWY